MLEERERRNYSQSTVRAYVATIRDLARYFKRPPDQLGPEQLREYQAYLFRERKLAANARRRYAFFTSQRCAIHGRLPKHRILGKPSGFRRS
jgi:hypothetical protein